MTMLRTLLVPLLVFAPLLSAQSQSSRACENLSHVSMAGVTITTAEAVPAGKVIPPTYPDSPSIGPLPAHCRVDGVMHPRKGVDGQEFGIGFSVALPPPGAWSHDLIMQGGGGANGVVFYPTGASFAGDESAHSRGFAVVSTHLRSACPLLRPTTP